MHYKSITNIAYRHRKGLENIILRIKKCQHIFLSRTRGGDFSLNQCIFYLKPDLYLFQESRALDAKYFKKKPTQMTTEEREALNANHNFKARLPKSLAHVVRTSYQTFYKMKQNSIFSFTAENII